MQREFQLFQNYTLYYFVTYCRSWMPAQRNENVHEFIRLQGSKWGGAGSLFVLKYKLFPIGLSELPTTSSHVDVRSSLNPWTGHFCTSEKYSLKIFVSSSLYICFRKTFKTKSKITKWVLWIVPSKSFFLIHKLGLSYLRSSRSWYSGEQSPVSPRQNMPSALIFWGDKAVPYSFELTVTKVTIVKAAI